MTSEDGKSLVDQALDAFVYAPIGLLLEARELIPKLADRGRGQVALARLAGRVAQNRRAPDIADDPVVPTPSPERTTNLPIADYDDLSSPQLLPRLESLDLDELAILLGHEQAHRARTTVVNRIRQLQS